MVRPHDLGMNSCRSDSILQFFRHQHIIDPPAYISGSSIRPMRPPRVKTVAFIEHPERIYEAGIDKLLKPFALLERKTLQAFVFLRPRQIIDRKSVV